MPMRIPAALIDRVRPATSKPVDPQELYETFLEWLEKHGG